MTETEQLKEGYEGTPEDARAPYSNKINLKTVSKKALWKAYTELVEKYNTLVGLDKEEEYDKPKHLLNPVVLRTNGECNEFMKLFPQVKLHWFISGKYKLPVIVYSDSANYTKEENYLQEELHNLSKNRQEETLNQVEWSNARKLYLKDVT